jgi:hypothetical protein
LLIKKSFWLIKKIGCFLRGLGKYSAKVKQQSTQSAPQVKAMTRHFFCSGKITLTITAAFQELRILN